MLRHLPMVAFLFAFGLSVPALADGDHDPLGGGIIGFLGDGSSVFAFGFVTTRGLSDGFTDPGFSRPFSTIGQPLLSSRSLLRTHRNVIVNPLGGGVAVVPRGARVLLDPDR